MEERQRLAQTKGRIKRIMVGASRLIGYEFRGIPLV